MSVGAERDVLERQHAVLRQRYHWDPCHRYFIPSKLGLDARFKPRLPHRPYESVTQLLTPLHTLHPRPPPPYPLPSFASVLCVIFIWLLKFSCVCIHCHWWGCGQYGRGRTFMSERRISLKCLCETERWGGGGIHGRGNETFYWPTNTNRNCRTKWGCLQKACSAIQNRFVLVMKSNTSDVCGTLESEVGLF